MGIHIIQTPYLRQNNCMLHPLTSSEGKQYNTCPLDGGYKK